MSLSQHSLQWTRINVMTDMVQCQAPPEESLVTAHQIPGLFVLLPIMQGCLFHRVKRQIAELTIHPKEVANLLVFHVDALSPALNVLFTPHQLCPWRCVGGAGRRSRHILLNIDHRQNFLLLLNFHFELLLLVTIFFDGRDHGDHSWWCGFLVVRHHGFTALVHHFVYLVILKDIHFVRTVHRTVVAGQIGLGQLNGFVETVKVGGDRPTCGAYAR